MKKTILLFFMSLICFSHINIAISECICGKKYCFDDETLKKCTKNTTPITTSQGGAVNFKPSLQPPLVGGGGGGLTNMPRRANDFGAIQNQKKLNDISKQNELDVPIKQKQ